MTALLIQWYEVHIILTFVCFKTIPLPRRIQLEWPHVFLLMDPYSDFFLSPGSYLELIITTEIKLYYSSYWVNLELMGKWVVDPSFDWKYYLRTSERVQWIKALLACKPDTFNLIPGFHMSERKMKKQNSPGSSDFQIAKALWHKSPCTNVQKIIKYNKKMFAEIVE